MDTPDRRPESYDAPVIEDIDTADDREFAVTPGDGGGSPERN